VSNAVITMPTVSDRPNNKCSASALPKTSATSQAMIATSAISQSTRFTTGG
jgi:hypothetical protein